MICDVCGSAFTDASNLRRHQKSHEAGGNHVCEDCGKCFKRSDYLTKHVQSVHNLKKQNAKKSVKDAQHTCSLCGKSYGLSLFRLQGCLPHDGKRYGLRKNLLRHFKEKHTEESRVDSDIDQIDVRQQQNVVVEVVDEEEKRYSLPCPECDVTSQNYASFRKHLTNSHNFDCDMEFLNFDSKERFLVWKESMETKSFCSFVNRYGVRRVVGGKRFYYDCHRSGIFKSRGKGVRILNRETAKIGATCPATMKVFEKSDGKIEVEWQKCHFGHDCDINFLKLTETERKMIASRLKEGTSFDRILDDVRDSVESVDDYKRLHLLERRDLWNILRTVEFKHSHAHQNDAMSVDMIVEGMKKKGDKNPVIFYKPQDQPCTCSDIDCKLEPSDFMLVICTPYQCEQLAHFGDDKILIDSTHGTNSYDFQLTTLASVDSAGVGVPLAYCISNRVNVESMTLFFKLVKEKIGKKKKTKVFMSDLAAEFYNAWKCVMGECDHILYCSWHVDKRWRLKVKEYVRGSQKQVEIYRALISLRNMLDKDWFEVCIEGFKNMLTEDDDTQPFLQYFQSYLSCKEKWAYCYRAGLGLNTNMFMEAMHKKLKYSYMKGKKLRRVDECIFILLRFTRDVAHERLRRKVKGNNSYRYTELISSHKKSVAMGTEWLEQHVIEKDAGVSWLVKSFTGSVHHHSVEINQDNDCLGCELVCVKCKFCVHDFKCSCHEFMIRGIMCKHIHSVLIVFMLEKSDKQVRSLMERVEDEIEAICENSNADKAGDIVDTADMWQPVKRHLRHLLDCFDGDVPESVIEGGLKYLELLRRDLPSTKQDSPPSSPQIERTQPSEPFTPSLCLTPSSRMSYTPTNSRISPQRRLLNFRSTKKRPMKKKLSLVKPTFHQEGAFIASFSLANSGLEVMNVHARESDHSYSQMDVDDLN